MIIVEIYKKHLAEASASAFVRGAANLFTFDQGPKIKAGVDYLAKKTLGKDTSYDAELKQEIEKDTEAQNKYPGSYFAGQAAAFAVPAGLAVRAIPATYRAASAALKAAPGAWNKIKTAATGTTKFAGRVVADTAKTMGRVGAADAAVSSSNKAVQAIKRDTVRR